MKFKETTELTGLVNAKQYKYVVDIYAELVPAKSAGGFYIGMHLREINSLIKSACTENLRPDFNMIKAIKNNNNFLCIKNYFGEGKTTVFYKNDIIRLQFNSNSILYCIYAFKGYKGKFKGNISIGSVLKKVAGSNLLYYDDEDEMHYFMDSSQKPNVGIAFSAEETPITENPDQIINGFCIYNWGLY